MAKMISLFDRSNFSIRIMKIPKQLIFRKYWRDEPGILLLGYNDKEEVTMGFILMFRSSKKGSNKKVEYQSIIKRRPKMRDKKNLVELICGIARDVIPDIEGQVGTPTGKENLFFFSGNFRERLDRAMAEDDFDWEGWRDFRSLVEDVFPEFLGSVFDNGLFLTPEEQLKIQDRLENLKIFLERNKEAKNE